ncbi:response regulator [Desulfopila sp. IMCC35006]|uniref:response regulator n=1 Tax=Desulfopila sp. IMCC35006 TaxID=2569542 RepID=UPI0010AB7E2E|nr:response regulator [Desulfopila sp. IMCC35006]TKB25900.1 response regulator [Desulfopila sp. IMCC35006]
MKNKEDIHILLIEDDTDDALLFMEMISDEKTGTIGIEHVASLTAGIVRIREGGIDIVLSDLGLPESRGLGTLELLLPEVGRRLPVIVLTDLADQEIGTEALRAGAQDYLFKEEVTGSLLVRSILYAIERKKMMVEREKLRQELEDALERVKLLSGFLPICCSCKKIRDDKGYWQQIELYIMNHSDVEFSHGICEECSKELYPELYANASE